MDNILNIPTSTKQYLYMSVDLEEDVIVDINTIAVKSCLVPLGSSPTDSDFKNASWAGIAGERLVRLLIGSGSDWGIIEQRKAYRQWARITSDPERPDIVGDTIISGF